MRIRVVEPGDFVYIRAHEAFSRWKDVKTRRFQKVFVIRPQTSWFHVQPNSKSDQKRNSTKMIANHWKKEDNGVFQEEEKEQTTTKRRRKCDDEEEEEKRKKTWQKMNRLLIQAILLSQHEVLNSK